MTMDAPVPALERTASDYAEEALIPHIKKTFPPGTKVDYKVTPYSIVCVVDVPHAFAQIERRPMHMQPGDVPMEVKHCHRQGVHYPHRWFSPDAGAERWCGGVS